MKKFISFFVILLMLASICLPSYAFADTVTTKAESTQWTSATREGYEEDMVRGMDITLPVNICIVTVCVFTVCGIVMIRKVRGNGL